MAPTVRTQLPPPKGSIFEITLAGLPEGEAEAQESLEGTGAERPYALLKHRFVLPALVVALAGWAIALGFMLWPRREAPGPAAAAMVEPPEDLRAYHLQAEAGDVIAMRTLGLRYCYGLSAPMNPQEGVKWLRKAADIGSLPARQELAAMGIRGQ